jgi:hypothetical protein
VLVSITETVLEPESVTWTSFPSDVTANPVGEEPAGNAIDVAMCVAVLMAETVPPSVY